MSIVARDDILTTPQRANSKTKGYILTFTVILSLFFIAVALTPSSSYDSFAQTYLYFAALLFFLLGLSYATNGNLTNSVIYGKIGKPHNGIWLTLFNDSRQVYVEFILGGVTAIPILLILGVSAASIVPITLPTAASIATAVSVTGYGALLAYIFVRGIISPDQEEAIFASSILPTIATDAKSVIAGASIIIGLAIAFLYIQQLEISFILAIFLLVYLAVPKFRKLLLQSTGAMIYAMIFTTVLFLIYHIPVYENSPEFAGILVGLTIFRLIAFIGNWVRQNTIFSRGMHSTFNVLPALLLFPGGFLTNLPLGIFVIGIYATGLWAVHKFTDEKFS